MMQLAATESAEARFRQYLQKTFKKTGSLFAHSCQAVAVLSGGGEALASTAWQFGRSFGIGFQLIDDLLDFVAQSDSFGKPVVADLKLGLATAPVLFAARQVTEEKSRSERSFKNSPFEKYLSRC